MNDKTEHHEYYSRGFNIPIHIVDLVEREEITVKEAYLLALIDGMVDHKGLGCFASNGWLAKRVQTQTRQLQRYLNHLIDKKLIVVVNKGDGNFGSRILETAWSRVRTTPVKSDRGGCQKRQGGSAQNDVTPPVKNDVHINTETDTDKDDQYVADTSATARSSHSSKDLNGSSIEEDAGMVLARRLKAFLVKRGLLNHEPKLKVWGKEFTALLNRGKSFEEVEEAMSWYEKHSIDNKEKEKKFYPPDIQSGKSFREKYTTLINAMNRWKELEEEDSEYGTWSNPIPTTIITLLKDRRSHVTKNPNLDWDLIHRIARQRKCSVGELSVCILLDPNNGEEPVTIKHPNEQQAMMKKMGWTHPK